MLLTDVERARFSKRMKIAIGVNPQLGRRVISRCELLARVTKRFVGRATMIMLRLWRLATDDRKWVRVSEREISTDMYEYLHIEVWIYISKLHIAM